VSLFVRGSLNGIEGAQKVEEVGHIQTACPFNLPNVDSRWGIWRTQFSSPRKTCMWGKTLGKSFLLQSSEKRSYMQNGPPCTEGIRQNKLGAFAKRTKVSGKARMGDNQIPGRLESEDTGDRWEVEDWLGKSNPRDGKWRIFSIAVTGALKGSPMQKGNRSRGRQVPANNQGTSEL